MIIGRVYSSILIFSLYFLYSNGHVPCKSGPACPDDFECSENGTLCCRNEDCSMRSRWSFLKSECKDGVHFSSRTHYCNEYLRLGINKQVSLCDSYLDMEEKLKCGSGGYLIKNGFEKCSRLYLNYEETQSFDSRSAMNCAEECRRTVISRITHKVGAKCEDLEAKVTIVEPLCYAKCNFCFVPKNWPLLFDIMDLQSANREWIEGLAEKCNSMYSQAISNQVRLQVEYNSRRFAREVFNLTGVDTSHMFSDFSSNSTTTTKLPKSSENAQIDSKVGLPNIKLPQISLPNTNIKISNDFGNNSTTLAPIRLSNEEGKLLPKSINNTVNSNTTIDLNICEFKRGTFDFKFECSYFIFIILLFILVNILVFFIIFKFANRSVRYRVE